MLLPLRQPCPDTIPEAAIDDGGDLRPERLPAEGLYEFAIVSGVPENSLDGVHSPDPPQRRCEALVIQSPRDRQETRTVVRIAEDAPHCLRSLHVDRPGTRLLVEQEPHRRLAERESSERRATCLPVEHAGLDLLSLAGCEVPLQREVHLAHA
jgi:hypothetical protein